MKRLYGLIGNPLQQSFSKSFFDSYFLKHNIYDAEFVNFQLNSVEQLPELLQSETRIIGLSVTHPFKELVLNTLHALDPISKSIGAVNCIRIHQKKYFGFNTDVTGFEKSIRPFLSPSHQPALILGTGGAAKAVKFVLHKLQWPCKLVGRNNPIQDYSYTELTQEHIRHFKFIIQTTPLGMGNLKDQLPPLPYEGIGNSHFVMDLIYNPEKTPFLKAAEARGALILNGLDMLKFQAIESWKIWNLVSD